MMNTVRWQQRFDLFLKALSRIEAVGVDIEKLSELEQDGVIQRFEFTYELAWKVMQDYLKEIGFSDIKGPRPSIVGFGKLNLLDPFLWQDALETRNMLSHVYDEQESRLLLRKIIGDYLPLFQNFKTKMTEKYVIQP